MIVYLYCLFQLWFLLLLSFNNVKLDSESENNYLKLKNENPL